MVTLLGLKQRSPNDQQIAARAKIDEIDNLASKNLLRSELRDPESDVLTEAEVDVENSTLAKMAMNPKIRYIANKVGIPPIDLITARRKVGQQTSQKLNKSINIEMKLILR